MTIANRARAAAFNFEAKKDGLTQLQGGNWKVTFTVADMPPQLTEAPMGTRFQCALVEIGDNEEPVDRKPKQRWSEMSRVKQAGILCADPKFQKWMGFLDERNTTLQVRHLCGVESRADLDTNEAAGKEWDALVMEYQMATGQLAERTG